MITLICRYFSRVIFLMLAGISWVAVAKEDHSPVRITSGEFPPYLSKTLQHGGIGLRIIREAFAHEGIDIEVGFYPWKRAYALARDGQWQASATWSHNETRHQEVLFSDPLYYSPYAFFYRSSEAFDWQQLEDLKPFTIGASSGYAYTKALWEYGDKGILSIQTAETDEQNFRKLMRGRIDLFPSNVDVGLYLLKKHFSASERAKITYHPKRFMNITTHLVFSRKLPANKALIKRFNRGLAHLKASGTIDQYLEEYRMGRVSY